MKNLALFIQKSEEKTAVYSGFIYIWYDTKRKKFYIGSHKGHVVDNNQDGFYWLNKNNYFYA